MVTLLESLKTLKPWQVGVLAAILVGAAGATYGVSAITGRSSTTDLSKNQQLIPVVYGNVVNQVSTNGSLLFANRATLSFGTQGTVGEVLVMEGQQVKEGQPLARLDAATSASLEKAVAQARVNLRNAEDALATAKAPYTPDDIGRARAQVDSAKVSLSNSEKDLKFAQKDWVAKVKTTGDALATGKADYQGIFPKWLGIQIGQDQADLAPDAVLASWKVDLNALFDPGLRSQDTSMGLLAGGLPHDAPATPWNESIIYAWLNLYPALLFPTCESKAVLGQETCVKKEMDDAWDAYQRAKDNLETVQTQASKAIASAESGVTRAKESLDAAEETLADMNGGADTLLVALREAELTSAKVSLDTALQRLEGATLKAPMAGVVSLVNVAAGQTVNANATIVEVVDANRVELDGVVDQTDVLFVRVGAQASVTMDALPGRVLQGTVASIASSAQTQQGVVSYPITVLLDVPQGLQLREGLSATASIVIRQENDVLLVPLQALYGTFDQPVVKLVKNGRTEERPVVLGISDDYWVAVRQGLAQGEQVVMEAQQASAGQLNVGQAFRQFQGQFGQGTFQGSGGPQGGGGNAPQGRPTPRATPRPDR